MQNHIKKQLTSSSHQQMIFYHSERQDDEVTFLKSIQCFEWPQIEVEEDPWYLKDTIGTRCSYFTEKCTRNFLPSGFLFCLQVNNNKHVLMTWTNWKKMPMLRTRMYCPIKTIRNIGIVRVIVYFWTK